MQDNKEENIGPDVKQAIENTKPLSEASRALTNRAIADAAREAGRTAEEQKDRMADRFRYMSVEQDPRQPQLDDYEERGGEVRAWDIAPFADEEVNVP